MQSSQDTPSSRNVRVMLIIIGITIPVSFIALLILISMIVFPPPFIPAPPDMLHQVARIAFVAFWIIAWFIGIGYLTRVIIHSRRAKASGMPVDLPKWITSTAPLKLLHVIVFLIIFCFFKTLYQMIFINMPFSIPLIFNGMAYPIMYMILSLSIQSIKANAGERRYVSDPYAGLAITGYIFGAISWFFVGTIYLFSLPFAIVGIILSLVGRISITRKPQANWGLGFSIIGILAPIIVIMISMALSHCTGWPGWGCSIPIAIDELFQ